MRHEGKPTYGMEEELIVVDRQTLMPATPCKEAVDALGQTLGLRFALEYKASVIEVVTGVHEDVFELTEEAAANRFEANAILQAFGYVAVPLALHPSAIAINMPAREGDRYRAIENRKGDAVKRLAAQGVHLHIGTFHDSERIGIMRRLMHLVPVHSAVTACSPLVEGHNSGQATWRLRILMQLSASLPLLAADQDEQERICTAIAAAGGPLDASEQWGLIRLGAGDKPTVELRAGDTVPSLDDIAWMAALSGATAYAHKMGFLPSFVSSDDALTSIYLANVECAAAKGDRAMLVDPFDLEVRSVPEFVDAWIERLQPAIDALALQDAVALRPDLPRQRWRHMLEFAECEEAAALARGLSPEDALAFAHRSIVQQAILEAQSTPTMPWAHHPKLAA